LARIEFVGLAHAYRPDPRRPEDYALRPMDMVWEDGGAYALLGPSGCGKTTLLNIVSGLLQPLQGKVLIDGQDVTARSPGERNIAQVFQFPVIYDTMTVFENLAFPLRNRRLPAAEVRKRVEEVAELLELTRDLPRRASGLGADDKQKISLGRGLVRKDVAAILFDEPLTVIDPHLKWLLRRKLKQIHQQLRLTLIYVTHDQVEALTFADRVVVMTEGQVVQSGTPAELFEAPRHTFVGYFIGSPGMNLLPCELGAGTLRLAGRELPIPADLQARLGRPGEAITLGIRPEWVELTDAGAPGAVPAEVVRVQDLGAYQLVTARLDGRTVSAKLRGAGLPAAGEAAWLRVLGPRTQFYRNEERITP
jgi:glycerol transport system ATP-binding protein